MPLPAEFSETELPGILEVGAKAFADERGYFTEIHAQESWTDAGMNESFVQDNLSQSAKGTLRGLHYQIDPHGQGKFVRVLTGAVFDVAVDLRRGSPTFRQWVGRTLSAENCLGLWVPVGFAHGFLALEDETLVLYKCTHAYCPEAERSLLYSDPEIGIVWPMEPEIISPKDAEAPPLSEADYNFSFSEKP
ncbi:MAG: dTDP-4-dehydrorhamnose 3,5-epimerase [Candidatus Hydrogenedentes bacterium]|nr:dTDP-4-dehydrorhamnose 3,5-epimerase [Candidatus Hydrogenedentota bacterium]